MFTQKEKNEKEKMKGRNNMANIEYEFYSEKDADAVANLMKSNKFWIGKYDEDLTGEKFIDYQRKKGTLFAVVGKKDGKAVSYVAAYKTGGQKVANKNQAFACALIIDQKYQMSVFSINEMFSMLITELVKRGYNDLICEVAKDNYPSFYMMRKCGFVIINEEPTLYGDYILHNYLPSVIKLAGRIEYANSSALPEIMQKLDKKNLYKAEKLIDERFISIDYRVEKKDYSLFIDTLSADIAGLHMKDHGVKIWPGDKNLTAYKLENTGEEIKTVEVEVVLKDGSVKQDVFGEGLFEINLPQNTESISFRIEGYQEKFTFSVDEIREHGRYKFEQSVIKLNDFGFEEKSAFLDCGTAENGTVPFKEMWPHVCAPYIEGIFIPNYGKKISVEKISDGEIRVTETNDDFVLTRDYKAVGNKTEIHTVAKMLSEKKMQPMFHFALYDLSYKMSILLDDNTSAERKFNPEDGHTVTEEMIFLDFLKNPYSEKNFEEIDIKFDSVPNAVYKIKTEKKAKCFCQLNFLGIKYDEEIYEGKTEVDFGTVTIEKIEG